MKIDLELRKRIRECLNDGLSRKQAMDVTGCTSREVNKVFHEASRDSCSRHMPALPGDALNYRPKQIGKWPDGVCYE